MLVLTRRLGESIIIDGRINVTILAAHGGKIRLGISAPRDVSIDRPDGLRREQALSAATVPGVSLVTRPRAGQGRKPI